MCEGKSRGTGEGGLREGGWLTDLVLLLLIDYSLCFDRHDRLEIEKERKGIKRSKQTVK